MTKPKSKSDPVQVAKAIAKVTNLPLPRVSQVMQKYPLDRDPKKLVDECLALAAKEMRTDLNKMFNLS